MTYVYTACTVCVTIFSSGGKFRPVSNFTELQLLLQPPVFTCSCILTSPLMQVCSQARLVSCPDPTQLTRREGVWCHKSKSLGKLSQKICVYVRMRPSVALEEASCYFGENCLLAQKNFFFFEAF